MNGISPSALEQAARLRAAARLAADGELSELAASGEGIDGHYHVCDGELAPYTEKRRFIMSVLSSIESLPCAPS